ncbi:MAG TPA: hypothetical protein DDX39_02800 [Bacteroidales bacterium]|nr:MAG: hypothetical protein A2W98_06355 [Bacteroidetes bacterium GWF2_33_38]OFY72856.1 MAG: hypothetical protein A2265_04250 [Bacteroidetes bacterium RIFOXYA12_FULL_33_9]OFY88943.1 MAG: hypothetical protein A2236_07265 [Bacteroidetes bacterium RIFOXYA2_FULL_33_7]HBF87546.1 hypothetical protein [Bacteroidales bacterium]
MLACNEQIVEEVEKYHNDSIPAVINYYKFENEQKILFKQIKYYSNKQIEVEGEFDENGKRTGVWTYWTPKGNKWSEGGFENGLSQGNRTVWHKDGVKYYDGYYNEGKPDKKWIFFNEEGKKIKEVEYEKGVIISQKDF